jgi:allophanate hydrolase
VTPVEAVEAALAADRAHNDPAIWITRVPDDVVLAQAQKLQAEGRCGRPFWGVPFAVKDNIDVAGQPTTAACPGFAYVAETNAPAVQRLLDAGAVMLGKTNLDQFATGLVGTRSPYGIPRNLFDRLRIPGGVRQYRRAEADRRQRADAGRGAGLPLGRYGVGVRAFGGRGAGGAAGDRRLRPG